jgi:hypothetical protein
MVGAFRVRSASVLGDPSVAGLIDDLTRRSPEFRQWWTEQAISEVSTYQYVCNHPFVGRLEFDYSCFGVLEYPDLSAVALATEQEDTRQRLAELTRQVDHGEHDADRNLWTALASQLSAPARQDHHSHYQ